MIPSRVPKFAVVGPKVTSNSNIPRAWKNSQLDAEAHAGQLFASGRVSERDVLYVVEIKAVIRKAPPPPTQVLMGEEMDDYLRETARDD
jgi:hypothetical protein